MSVQTLVACLTITKLGIPPALRHAPKVILVQELASITFLAKTAKPVFADCSKTFTVSRVTRKLLRGLEVLR
jgi:hypothetical protein